MAGSKSDSFSGRQFVLKELERIRSAGLERRIEDVSASDKPGYCVVRGRPVLDFCSNDYLGLSRHPEVIRSLGDTARESGCGAGASRLMSGSRRVHSLLEMATANLKNHQDAMLFGSGYLANTGIIPAICGRKDAVFSDRLNHASIIDGIRLSGARHFRYRHLDLSHLEELLVRERKKYRRALVVTESVFSMDGDIADIPALISLAESCDAMLMVDEAHATGVFGAIGEGVAGRDMAHRVDVITGTYGKALGSYGAYAVMSGELKRLLASTCRTFIYSTALPPPVAAAALTGLEIAVREEGLRKRLLGLASFLRQMLFDTCGLETCGASQIVPVMCGDNRRAVELQQHLFEQGFYARAIRPPTVPEGTARIRLSVTVNHGRDELERLVETVRSWMRSEG